MTPIRPNKSNHLYPFFNSLLSLLTLQTFHLKMAVKRRSTKRVTRRKAAKVPRAAKRVAKRATRKAARKAAKVPKAPKRTARRRTARKAAKVPRAAKRSKKVRRSSKKAKRVSRKSVRKPKIKYGSMRRVWSGTADRTKGGLTKKDLAQNKNGRVVSKKKLATSKKAFKNSALSRWCAAVQKARKELGLTGFVACKKGTAFYKLTRKYYN